MSIDERKRHALYERLDQVLDGEHADTLMELLPPVGWADVATKQDLAVLRKDLEGLEQRMDLRFEAMESRFDARLVSEISAVRSELHTALRNQTWSIVGVLFVAIFVSELLRRIG